MTLEWHWTWDDLYLVYNLDLRHVKPSQTDVYVAKWTFSNTQSKCTTIQTNEVSGSIISLIAQTDRHTCSLQKHYLTSCAEGTNVSQFHIYNCVFSVSVALDVNISSVNL